jgi:Importin beta binding domain
LARKKGFKKGVDQDDSRRRRTETTIQIRKEKKNDQIQKRRGVSSILKLFSARESVYLVVYDAVCSNFVDDAGCA